MILEHKLIPRTNPTGRGCQPRITVMQCDICGSRFERPYSCLFEKMTVHRCSRKCTYGHRKGDGLGARGARVVERPCAVCEKMLRRVVNGIADDHRWFCSRGCYGVWRSENPGSWIASYEAMCSPESRQKATKTRSQRWRDGLLVHPMQGRHHSPETIDLIKSRREENPLSGEKNGMFGRRHTAETRASMSERRAQLIVEGAVKPYGKNGHARGDHESPKLGKSVFFRSSWELALFKYLDGDAAVKTYHVEPVKIAYVYDNHTRWYVPGVIVEYVDGSSRLIEVKPTQFVHNEKTRLKSEAAIEWCRQNDVQAFNILTKQDLINMGCVL